MRPWGQQRPPAGHQSVFRGIEPGHVLHTLSRCGTRRTRAKRAAEIHHQSRLSGKNSARQRWISKSRPARTPRSSKNRYSRSATTSRRSASPKTTPRTPGTPISPRYSCSTSGTRPALQEMQEDATFSKLTRRIPALNRRNMPIVENSLGVTKTFTMFLANRYGRNCKHAAHSHKGATAVFDVSENMQVAAALEQVKDD